MLIKKICFSFLFVLIACHVHAQSILTLDSAISTALEKNYDIIIADLQKQQADVNANASKGNFLPEVFVNGTWQKNKQNLNQSYANGLEVNKNKVKSDALNASANLSWTLFDGMLMFANRNLTLTQRDAAGFNLKQQMENTIATVMTAYYAVVQQKGIINAQQSNLSLTEVRLKITQTKKDVGSASQLELMQVMIDYNNQKAELLRQQMNLQIVKSVLIDLLAMNADANFDVNDSIVINYNPSFEELRKTIATQNTGIKLAEKNIAISDLYIKEFKSNYYPRLNFFSAYNFAQNNSEAGFLLKSDNIGLNYGFTASWSLFNKFIYSRQVKYAKIDYRISQTELAALKTNIDSRLLWSFNNFQMAMQIVNLVKETSSLAGEAANISLDRFKLGKTSILELKDAQNVFQSTTTAYINALYAAKLNEIQLMKLNGELVK